jgi:hypothetical protein
LEDLGDGMTFASLDFLIEIEKGSVKTFRNSSTGGCLP